MSTEQEQVQVRFITQQTEYAVSDSAILVPSNLKKDGLSEIVNSLIGLDKPIPFDFLIDGQLLRSSIVDYLNDHKLSTENLVVIEYVESMLPPEPLTAYQHDDWISSVHARDGLFLTGSYDNMVRLWNTSGECVATLMGHDDSVKSVAFGSFSETSATVFSGSLDHTVLGWSFSLEDSTHRVMYECKGHKAPVESVAVQDGKLASASSDGLVKVWSTAEPTEDEPEDTKSPAKKRKKTTAAVDGRKIKTQAINLEGHVGGVNAVTFDTLDSNIVYTGGWDHSIRSWDVEQQVNLTTKNCEKVVLDVDYSSNSKLLATGHADNTVRLWDSRAEDGTNVKMTLRGHSAWVSSVSWSRTSEYALCSASYDSTIRVWDIRSKEALYTVDNTEDKDKILSVYWDNDRIISGGEDKKLRLYQAKV